VALRAPDFSGWFREEGRWGVAVSGGGDSMALLHMLLKAGYATRIVVLHFNHMWGPWGREAEAFVRAFCARHKLKLVAGQGKGRARANAEAKAREERLAFFAAAMAAEKLDGVMTAHTASDDVEGFLIRLARGSGLNGLTGMMPLDSTMATEKRLVRLGRPLLERQYTRAALRDYLKAQKARWLDDPSNTGDDTMRARMRKLWPLMEKAGFTEAVVKATMGHLTRSWLLIAPLAEAAWTACLVRDDGDTLTLDRRAFNGTEPELAQQIVARVITWMTGARMAPRLTKRLDLVMDIRSPAKKGKATLGGVLWTWTGNKIVATRERKRPLR
jgi:tRNA(Ile)-lysidine synthase